MEENQRINCSVSSCKYNNQMDQLICPTYVSFQNSLFVCLECVCVRRDHLVPGTDILNHSQAGRRQNHCPCHKAYRIGGLLIESLYTAQAEDRQRTSPELERIIESV